MFKNRIRTAAIAGCVAVATGVAGLAVPANANPVLDHATLNFNEADGSAQRLGGQVVVPSFADGSAEFQLDRALDVAIDAIFATDINSRTYDENHQYIIAEYLSAFAEKDNGGALDPSEEAIKNAFVQGRNDLASDLEKAVELSKSAQATVKDAVAADKAVQEKAEAYAAAQNAYVEAVARTVNPNIGDRVEWLRELDRVEALEKAANEKIADGATKNLKYRNPVNVDPAEGGYDPSKPYTEQTQTVKDRTYRYILDVEEARQYLRDGANPEYEKDRDTQIDKDRIIVIENFLSLPQLQEVFAAEKARDDARNEFRRSGLDAERTDVRVLQVLANRADAFVQALRMIQAQYNAVARYADLYENDALTADHKSTLRAEYRKLIQGPSNTGIRNPAGFNQVVTPADFNGEKAGPLYADTVQKYTSDFYYFDVSEREKIDLAIDENDRDSAWKFEDQNDFDPHDLRNVEIVWSTNPSEEPWIVDVKYDEQDKIDEDRLAQAVQALSGTQAGYYGLIQRGNAWVDPLTLVVEQDKLLSREAQADRIAADTEAAKQAAEEAERRHKEIVDAIAGNSSQTPAPGGNDNQGGDNQGGSSFDFSGSSVNDDNNGIGTLGIVAIIAAVLAAIGGAIAAFAPQLFR